MKLYSALEATTTTKEKYEVNALVVDGLMIRKTKELSDELLDELNYEVFNKTGYEVEFIIKPMNEGFEVPEEELEDNKQDGEVIEKNERSDSTDSKESRESNDIRQCNESGNISYPEEKEPHKLTNGQYGHAQLFYDSYHENIVISNKICYMYDQKYCLWKQKDMSEITNLISPCLQQLIRKELINNNLKTPKNQIAIKEQIKKIMILTFY